MVIRNLLLVILSCMVLSLSLSAEDSSPWRDDFEKAMEESADRPLALLFSTPDCVWCHRMIDESSASAAVRQALTQVTGVIVQAEKNPALVAQLGIDSYPTLVLVNRKGELVRAIAGYLPEADLATALKVLALHGDQDGQRPANLTGTQNIKAITAGENAVEHLIALLGVGPVAQRADVRAALGTLPKARAALWLALDHARLGVRVDAAAALARQVGDPVGYDPLSVGDERRQAIARWQSQASATLPGGVVP
jgi:thioredoxin-related protein